MPAAPGWRSLRRCLRRASTCVRVWISSNAPTSANGVVTGYKPVVLVKNVQHRDLPDARRACMSSGFGTRSERLHKGVDYHADVGVPVLAGGDGTIVEIKYRDDYGNMILIDHGGGVYTRYAHLASFGKGLSPGRDGESGRALGLMGNTAAIRSRCTCTTNCWWAITAIRRPRSGWSRRTRCRSRLPARRGRRAVFAGALEREAAQVSSAAGGRGRSASCGLATGAAGRGGRQRFRWGRRPPRPSRSLAGRAMTAAGAMPAKGPLGVMRRSPMMLRA